MADTKLPDINDKSSGGSAAEDNKAAAEENSTTRRLGWGSSYGGLYDGYGPYSGFGIYIFSYLGDYYFLLQEN